MLWAQWVYLDEYVYLNQFGFQTPFENQNIQRLDSFEIFEYWISQVFGSQFILQLHASF